MLGSSQTIQSAVNAFITFSNVQCFALKYLDQWFSEVKNGLKNLEHENEMSFIHWGQRLCAVPSRIIQTSCDPAKAIINDLKVQPSCTAPTARLLKFYGVVLPSGRGYTIVQWVVLYFYLNDWRRCGSNQERQKKSFVSWMLLVPWPKTKFSLCAWNE